MRRYRRMWSFAGAAFLSAVALAFPFVQAFAAEKSAPLSREELSKALTVDLDSAGQFRTLAVVVRQPMADNDIVIPWLTENVGKLQPMFVMELSRRSFEQSHAEALEWFAVGYARVLYDAKRCADPSVGGDGLVFMLIARVAGPQVRSYLSSHGAEYAVAQQHALVRSDLFTDDVSPLWICSHGLSDYGQAITGQPAGNQLKPQQDWPALRQSVREAMAAAAGEALAAEAARKALPAGAVELRVAHKGVPYALAWNPDGTQLAMSLNGDKHLVIWDVASASVVQEIDRGTAAPDEIAFASSGREVVSSASDAIGGAVVTVFNTDPGAAIHHFGKVASLSHFAVDAARHLIAYVGEDNRKWVLTLVDLDNPTAPARVIPIADDRPSMLAFGRDGTLVVGTLLGKIMWFDVADGRLLGTMDAFEGWVMSLAFSPDGRYIAAGAEGGKRGRRGADGSINVAPVGDTLKIWRMSDRKQVLSCSVLLHDAPDDVESIAWSSDSRHFAFTGYSGIVTIRNIDAPQEAKVLMRFSPRSVQYSSASLVFSPDGTRLAMTGDNAALIVPITDDVDLEMRDEASCK